ncbi:MAG: CaiB/BaiF CoA transferase family protein [Lautropia sp.]
MSSFPQAGHPASGDDRAFPQAAGALDGLRVLDLTRVLAGPLCTQLLADHGADVLKIEAERGDDTRRLGAPEGDGSAPYFHALNRNKRAAVLDLASPEGRASLLALARDADVIVENFLPGTMRRWGLGYEETLAATNPGLIYCTITGFGEVGPLGGMPGYDAVAQAACGLMSVNGDDRTGPLRTGVPVVDIASGLYATIGILIALNERTRSGRGQRIDATLFDAGLSMLIPHAAEWLMQSREHVANGNRHPTVSPYDRFSAADGEVFIGILNDRQFQRFGQVIGEPGLGADPRFLTNELRVRHRDALTGLIREKLRTLNGEALCERLMHEGIPASVVRSVAQAIEHPHATARASVCTVGGWRSLANPIRLARTPASIRRLPPPLDPAARACWRAEKGVES